MSENKTAAPSGGIGVLGLLGVLFVALKLTGVINWSWWLVTLPFWGGLAVVLAIVALASAVWVGAAVAVKFEESRAKKKSR